MTVSKFVKLFNIVCCRYTAAGCDVCPLGNQSRGEICTEFVYKYPKLAQKIVQDVFDRKAIEPSEEQTD